MTSDEVRVHWQALKDFTRELFVRVGLPPEDAEIEADVLIWANLRGVDSHGVLRIPWYVELVDAGIFNLKPNIKVLNETAATILLDGDRAFGPVSTVRAMNMVIEKARDVGIGWCLIRNMTHQGAMGYYTLMAAREGMAGIAAVCSPPNMAPFGARAAGLHNSPLSIAVPAKQHKPIILDMATSIVAGGKLNLAIDKGSSIPVEWSLDRDGNPTTVPRLDNILLPSGGPKGSGLAMMLECLASLMAGNPLAAPSLTGRREALHGLQNSFVAAIDIGTFTDVEKYKEDVDALIAVEKSLPRAEGFDEIFIPGEPEDRAAADRLEHGIPLPKGTVANLREVAQRFGMPMPAGV